MSICDYFSLLFSICLSPLFPPFCLFFLLLVPLILSQSVCLSLCLYPFSLTYSIFLLYYISLCCLLVSLSLYMFLYLPIHMSVPIYLTIPPTLYSVSISLIGRWKRCVHEGQLLCLAHSSFYFFITFEQRRNCRKYKFVFSLKLYDPLRLLRASLSCTRLIVSLFGKKHNSCCSCCWCCCCCCWCCYSYWSCCCCFCYCYHCCYYC